MTKSKTPPTLLPCYDDLAGSLDYAWQMLARGVADRRSAFHTPSVATLGFDGAPRIRTVVLRGCNVADQVLRFHTDKRSAKIKEIAANDRGAMLFYDHGLKIQLRLSCQFYLSDQATWDAAWQATRAMSRECYQVEQAPGDVIDAPTRASFNAAATEDGADNFQPVLARVETIEWLYLAAKGHRRALFDLSQQPAEMQWLVP